MADNNLIAGEYRRVYDDRHRIALPPEVVDPIVDQEGNCVLAKEREGCLSLWNSEVWQRKVERRVEVVRQKLHSELLDHDLAKVQRFSRLLSTRSRAIKLGQRGRLLIPEGFREFLGVEPNTEVLVVGAGVCLEIWHPAALQAYLREDIGQFHTLLEELL